ncbi:hypothetical protein ACEYW6_17395, partial [Nostoc sp. UIC 10607]|uniref:hypothetical protein n=1 Tax=Nostoc sp. UIC 10607 TaxID=3045935 RepID=UPI0039A32DFC
KTDSYIEPQLEEQNDGYSQPQLEEQKSKDYFNRKDSQFLENKFEQEEGKFEISETKFLESKKIDDNKFKSNKQLGVYGERKASNQKNKTQQENQGEVKDDNGKIIGQMQNWHPAYKGKAIRHLYGRDRKAKKLKIQDGKLYGHDSESKEQDKEDQNKFIWKGKPYKTKEMKTLWGSSSGKAIFVMTVNGKIYAADQAAEYQQGLDPRQKQQWIFHHSSFVAGAEVAAAGEIEIKDGVLQGITDASGHYHPDAAMTRQVLQMLQDGGVSLKGVYVQITIPQENSNLIYPADKFLEHTTAKQEAQKIIENLREKQDLDTSILSESAELAEKAGNLFRQAKYISQLFEDMNDLLKPGQKKKIEIQMRNLYELALRKGWKAYKAGLTNQSNPDNDYLEAYISFEAAKEIESFNVKNVKFKKPDDVPQNAEASLQTMENTSMGATNALDRMRRLAREKNML